MSDHEYEFYDPRGTQPMPRERIGYDELLAARVSQLSELKHRINVMLDSLKDESRPQIYHVRLRQLRMEIDDMIRAAEAEHAAF